MIHSFLLIGQSNMAGRGFIGDAVDVDSSRIKVLRNGRWQPMYRPVNGDRPFSGVCLAERFAEKYAGKYGVDVGIIACADGGSSLDEWKKGSSLYDNAVFRAKLAERTSTLAGVLWHQGEADCRPELYATYYDRLTEMLKALQNDLNLHDVPILLGGLGDYLAECTLDCNLKNYTYVNEAIKKVAGNREMTGFVSAKGLTSNPDNLHFNARALYEFGERYFDVFETIKASDKVFSEKTDENEKYKNIMSNL